MCLHTHKRTKCSTHYSPRYLSVLSPVVNLGAMFFILRALFFTSLPPEHLMHFLHSFLSTIALYSVLFPSFYDRIFHSFSSFFYYANFYLCVCVRLLCFPAIKRLRSSLCALFPFRFHLSIGCCSRFSVGFPCELSRHNGKLNARHGKTYTSERFLNLACQLMCTIVAQSESSAVYP